MNKNISTYLSLREALAMPNVSAAEVTSAQTQEYHELLLGQRSFAAFQEILRTIRRERRQRLSTVGISFLIYVYGLYAFFQFDICVWLIYYSVIGAAAAAR